MNYFDAAYIVKENNKIIIEDIQSLAKILHQKGFLYKGIPLYIMKLDAKKSLSIKDEELRYKIIDILCLISATDVTARGGIVFNKTDGIEAIFQDGFQAIKSGVALYHRKKEIQDKIFKAMIKNFYAEKLRLREIIETELDYRICLCQFPLDLKQEILASIPINDSSTENSIIEFVNRIRKPWLEASSRLGNKQSFLISHDMYFNLPYNHFKKYFNTEKNVNFQPSGSTNVFIEKLFGKGFYHYRNNDIQYVHFEGVTIDGNLSSNEIEKVYRETCDDRRYFYRQKSDYSENTEDQQENELTQCHLFDYFKLEPILESSTFLKASVFGDINLDYITYLEREEMPNQGDMHLQLTKDIQKKIAGKGVNIAMALQKTKEFNPILLISKLGADFEGQHILSKLKDNIIEFHSIEPIFFFSHTYPTGTSISIRKENDSSSILTITDKPNANSDLSMPELESRMDEILSCDYIFISGYCLLDKRIHIVEKIVQQASRFAEKKVVLEMSPRLAVMNKFSESEEREDRLRHILKNTFLLVYEEGAFGDREDDFIADIPFKLKFDFRFNKIKEKVHNDQWKEISTSLMRKLKEPRESLGLINELTAEYINSKFIKAKILLCSKSPRRFELLSSVYGKSNILHYKDAESPEFPKNQFEDEYDFIISLITVSIEKLSSSLKRIIEDDPEQYREVKVALSSDLAVVVVNNKGQLRILDKPDSSPDPIGKAKKYLKDYLSGRTQSVWTCTCLISLRKFMIGQEWNKRVVNDNIAYLESAFAHDSNAAEKMRVLIKSLGSHPYSFEIDINTDRAESKNRIHLFIYKSNVEFKELTDEEIEEYVASGEWRTKGGGYAVQGNGGYFVDRIDGSFTNIMGFPIVEIAKIVSNSPYKIREICS